jgi:hypothetical protein
MDVLPFHALIQLRGTDANTTLARRALGPAATAGAVRSLSNYFSRVISGGVPQVGLEKLQQLANGLGYPTLAALFLDWAWVAQGKALPYRGYASEQFTQFGDPPSQKSEKGGKRTTAARTRVQDLGGYGEEDYDRAALSAAAISITQFAAQLDAFKTICLPWADRLSALLDKIDPAHSGVRPPLGGRRPRQPADHSPARPPRTGRR